MTLNLNELARGGTVCLSKAGVAIGGTTSKARTNAPNGAGVDFAINGILYHVADADNNIVLTGDVQTALYTNVYLVCINSANTITVVQGDEVLSASLTAGSVPLHWPTPTVNTCPIGAIKVAAGAGAFTPGTTALTGGTVTVTYYDLFAVPASPLTS
uniref:Uncharacterized protein n=1 Tax=viral metagenome TaxID=1070528 RepID=A0A6H1ZXW8_9ZZZZ